MTGWNNVGVFGPDAEAILRDLFTEFENSMNEGVVALDPPTVRLGPCENDRRRKERAETLLNIDAEVTAVVVLSNSDTADWGSAYIYHEPDDLRDIELQDSIIGESGQKAYDVESELQDRGYPVSKQHYLNRLEKQNHLDLFVDGE